MSGGERGGRSGFGAPIQLVGVWAAAGAAIGAGIGLFVGEIALGALIGAAIGAVSDARRMFRR